MRRARHREVEQSPGTAGVVRLDRTTPRLTARLRPGDIAVLDHVDLDGPTAQALVSRGVAAVVNASPSTSGRYPNRGPAVLVGAGIPLLDNVGAGVFTDLSEGKVVRVEGDALWAGERRIATGVLQDELTVATATDQARSGLAAQLADLTANATGFLLDERDLLLEGERVPSLRTPIEGRPVLLVASGYGEQEQLRRLRTWCRTHRPVLVGVDAGGDALLTAGLWPEVLVGDPASMSEAALRAARDVVVPEGCARSARCEELGVGLTSFATGAAHEDMALLLAGHAGATLLVVAGYPAALEDLLDRGRDGAASSVLTRLTLGDRIVTASALGATVATSRIWPGVLLLVLSALVLTLALLFVIAPYGVDVSLLSARWDELLTQLTW